MNILVCVKHVPCEEDMKLDPVTKTLVRSTGVGEISEMDKYALEIGVRAKEKLGGTVTSISMGPPASAGSLRYSLAVGGDNAYLVSDRAMGGADAYATAYTLAEAIKHLEGKLGRFDLILCGKRASDSDTALVVPELAELLGRPHVTNVVDCQASDCEAVVKRETDVGYDMIKLEYPGVLSVGKTEFPARYPNLKLKLKANRTEIPAINAEQLGVDPEKIGSSGSLTAVGMSYVPDNSKSTVIIKEKTEAESALKLADILSNAGLL